MGKGECNHIQEESDGMEGVPAPSSAEEMNEGRRVCMPKCRQGKFVSRGGWGGEGGE